MKRFLLHLAILSAVAICGGAVVVAFGLYNVSAMVGHLPGVPWILHTAYVNSVELRAMPESDVPELDAPSLIALGARHYDQACRVCHGLPEGPQNATMRSSVPQPPPIRAAVRNWKPRHLHWIVTNGVKMTGMPAWPAELRADDVWPVVAFLVAVRGMSNSEYLEIVAPPDGSAPERAACAMCHGADGQGRDNREMPRLGILSEAYIAAALRSYRDGRRQSGMMQHAAAHLSDDTITSLARHYAAQTPESAPVSGADPEMIRQGAALAEGSSAAPACRPCHGPWPARRDPSFPDLAGQRERYIRAQLLLWQSDSRGGSGRADMMRLTAHLLDPDGIDALAAYYTSLPPTE